MGPVSQHLQDCFLFLCITDKSFLQMVRTQLLPDFFTSQITETCIKICYEYYDVFKDAPGDHFSDEFHKQSAKLSKDDRPLYVRYLERIQNLETPSTKYVLSRVDDFIRARELETAAIEFAEDIKEGRFVQAENRMYEALRSGITREDVGLDYLTDYSKLRDRNDVDEFLMPTGIKALDRLVRGYKRSQFVCFLGGPKGKKSWCVMHLARTAIMHGLKVLHISHEMTEDEVERRYDQMFGGMVQTRTKDVSLVHHDPDRGMRHSREERPSIFDVHTVEKVREKVRRFGGRLIIKKYPMGTCTLEEIERYLEYLESFHGFVPDVLINDYVDIMNLSSHDNNLRHMLNRLYIGHKTIADERNILVVTVSQVNREAIKRRRIRMSDFAEDIRKAANIDLGIAICQTEDQEREELASLWIIARRQGGPGGACNIQMNLDVGRFCVHSWFEDSEDETHGH